MRNEQHVPYLRRRPCERSGVPTQSNDAGVDIPLAELLAKAADPNLLVGLQTTAGSTSAAVTGLYKKRQGAEVADDTGSE
jgi:hypothetical protein